jgi:hypothetical protein
LQEENLFYAKKEDQLELLQKVLAANDTAADDEDAQQQSAALKGAGGSQMFRSQGALSSLSGGDEGLYMEVRRQKEGAASKTHHPLFKKFYYKK